LSEGHAVCRIPRAGEDPIVELHVLRLHLPYPGGAGNHLPLDFLGGRDGRQASVVGDPAAAGASGEGDRIGVHHNGVDIFGPQAQRLGGLHGDGDSAAAQVHRAGDQVDGAVAVDMDGG
jgi:hypothetical protein